MLIFLRVFSAMVFMAMAAMVIGLTALSDVLTDWRGWPGLLVAVLASGTAVLIGSAVLTLVRRKRDLRRRRPELNRWENDVDVMATIPLRVWFVEIIGGVVLFALMTRSAVPMEGAPEFRDGKYVLHSHGRVIREITEEEFHRAEVDEVRNFAAFWLVAAWGPLVFFWLGPGRSVTLPPTDGPAPVRPRAPRP